MQKLDEITAIVADLHKQLIKTEQDITTIRSQLKQVLVFMDDLIAVEKDSTLS
jgi:hypothetical protein